MKTRKCIVRLFPDPGRIVPGCFVFVNEWMVVAEEVTNNSVTIIHGNEYIEYPKVACKLAKYFGFAKTGKNMIGEIAYRDYNKVSDNDIIIGELFQKLSPVEIGDKVRIDKPTLHDYDKCEKDGFEGSIIKCTSRIFDIALANCIIKDIARNQFKTISKPNFRNIIKYIKHI